MGTVGRNTHPIASLQRTSGNQAALRVIRSQAAEPPGRSEVLAAAQSAVSGRSGALPHGQTIGHAFGRHDVSKVQAHTDDNAAAGVNAMNAAAFTRGDHIAFASSSPSIHTVAHEAAHVVQQRSGVALADGVGERGDVWERHADAVAELVVQGKPAGPLLDEAVALGVGRAVQPPGNGANQPVQMQLLPAAKATPNQTMDLPELQRAAIQSMFEKWALINEIKEPIVREITEAYDNRPGQIFVPDQVFYGTPYGNRVVRGTRKPARERVYYAIYNAMDLTKTGKGQKVSDWNWRDAPRGKPKTDADLALEAGKFAVEELIDDKIKEPLIKATVETTAEWLATRGLLATAGFLTGAAEVFLLASFVYSAVELAISLGEPAPLSPYEQESAEIVADVKAFLLRQEEAAKLQESLAKPPKFETIPTKRDEIPTFPVPGRRSVVPR